MRQQKRVQLQQQQTTPTQPSTSAQPEVQKVAKALFGDSPEAVQKGPARSTRSRQPLVDKALEELEDDLLLVAPDFDPSIYDINAEVDDEYFDFLTSLRKSGSHLLT